MRISDWSSDVCSSDLNNIPGCTYCQPEIASVGFTEKAAVDAGYEIKVGKFPFSASGKAKAAGHADGFVKVIFDAKYGEWLGRSEEHTSELQSLMRISYAVFCLKKKRHITTTERKHH